MRRFLQRRFPLKSFLFDCLIAFLNSNDLNLSELTIVLLSENQLMAFSDSAISISNSNLTDLAIDDIVLSSARL